MNAGDDEEGATTKGKPKGATVTALAVRKSEVLEAPGRVDRAVAAIGRLHRATMLNFAIEVGKTVVEHMFDGDIKQARKKGPKEKTLKELADHPDLPMSAKQLSISVGIYEMLERLGKLQEVPTWELLGYSHVRALLPAPPKDQERLVGEALQNHWTVRQLDTEIAKVVAEPKGGTRRKSALTKAVKALDVDLDRLIKALEKAETVSVREGTAIRKALARASENMAKVRRLLPK